MKQIRHQGLKTSRAIAGVPPVGEGLRSSPRRPPFGRAVAHHWATGPDGDHAEAFHHATKNEGLDPSAYFRRAGVTKVARDNGGLCSFIFGGDVALLQTSNKPLLEDDALCPSIDSNAALFGDFVGAMENDHPARRARRLVVERALGTHKAVDGAVPAMRRLVDDFLQTCDRAQSVSEFALLLLAHVDSLLPGVLCLRDKPLTAYLRSGPYQAVAREFFEIASRALSNVDPGAIADSEMIVDFTRDVLLSNFDSLSGAPRSSLIRAQFDAWGLDFSRATVEQLCPEALKELGTVIVAAYDTTALSLLWAILYVEASPEIKQEVVVAAVEQDDEYLEHVALEAVRLGGSNPTALWRRVRRPTPIVHRGAEICLPPGTMLWLDRRGANRSPEHFGCPLTFDPDNISALRRTSRETVQSLISRNRYEINSFSMINATRNPRKCPGRYFAVRAQVVALQRLYSRYDVRVEGACLELRRGRSMPYPKQPGTLHIYPRSGVPCADPTTERSPVNTPEMSTLRAPVRLPPMPTEADARARFPRVEMTRAELDGDRVRFESGEQGFQQAIRQGFFLLKIPADVDLVPADRFVENFFRDRDGGPDDQFRGFRAIEVPGDYQGYFAREHDQWENFYIEMSNWSLIPRATARAGEQMTSIGITILRDVLRRLGIDQSLWPKITSGLSETNGHQMLAFNHFRPNEGTRGTKFHRDSGWVTVLRSTEPGLLALIDDELRAVDPEQGYFIVNFGSSIEVLTERLPTPVRANVHGVAKTMRSGSQPHRHSYVVFLDSSLDGMIYRYLDGAPVPVQTVAEFAVQEVSRTYDDTENL